MNKRSEIITITKNRYALASNYIKSKLGIVQK
jgi:hypothetical protein